MFYIYYAPDLGQHLRIHKGNCSWCKDGKGITGNRPDRWRGPYDTLPATIIEAVSLSPNYDLCGKCLKSTT